MFVHSIIIQTEDWSFIGVTFNVWLQVNIAHTFLARVYNLGAKNGQM